MEEPATLGRDMVTDMKDDGDILTEQERRQEIERTWRHANATRSTPTDSWLNGYQKDVRWLQDRLAQEERERERLAEGIGRIAFRFNLAIGTSDNDIQCIIEHADGEQERLAEAERERGKEQATVAYWRGRADGFEARLADAQAALERLADPTEMAGMGETETMIGEAAVELRIRMKYAAAALASSGADSGKEPWCMLAERDRGLTVSGCECGWPTSPCVNSGKEHPCPKGDDCALNSGAIHCFHCRRNWPRDETWDMPLDQRPVLGPSGKGRTLSEEEQYLANLRKECGERVAQAEDRGVTWVSCPVCNDGDAHVDVLALLEGERRDG